MITLTLVRHGESTDNLKSLWAGWKDAPLSNHGMNQAKALGASFASVPIAAIYFSPLKRAKTTAMEIFHRQETKPIFGESLLLREQHWGLAEGRPWSASTSSSAAPLKDYFPLPSGRTAKFPDGESREDVAKRASKAIDNFIVPHVLASQGLPETSTNVVVVAHGIFIAEMIGEFLRRRSGGTSEAYRFSGLVNTGWTRMIIGLEGEQSSLDGVTAPATGSTHETPDCTETINVEAEAAAPPPTLPVEMDTSAPRLTVRLVGINQAPHLEGLKRQGGGIGRAAFDEKQRSMHDFLGGGGGQK